MTDEQLGRKWAELHGVAPDQFADYKERGRYGLDPDECGWRVLWPDQPETPDIPECLRAAVGDRAPNSFDDFYLFGSESLAYAAIGAALREVLTPLLPLPSELLAELAKASEK